MTDETTPNGANPPPAERSSDSSDVRNTDIIITVLTFLLLVEALVPFNHKNLLLWGLLVVAAAPFIMTLIPRCRKYLPYGYAIAFAIVVIGLLLYRSIGYGNTEQTIKDPSSKISQISQLMFIPSTNPVSWCYTISGDGTVPQGDSLVIFDSPARDDTGKLLTPVKYGLQGIAVSSGGNWSISNAHILESKDRNGYDMVFAVLIKTQDALFINSIKAYLSGPVPKDVSLNPYWRSDSLPPSLERIPPLLLHRGESTSSVCA